VEGQAATGGGQAAAVKWKDRQQRCGGQATAVGKEGGVEGRQWRGGGQAAVSLGAVGWWKGGDLEAGVLGGDDRGGARWRCWGGEHRSHFDGLGVFLCFVVGEAMKWVLLC
jgi:hypothetical protein